MYKARVFPIPARGDVRIKLDYSQLIPVAAGLATYLYPLNTEKFSSAPLDEVAIRVRIKSQLPLTTVFCPSHRASVDKKGKHEAVIGYEAKKVLPDKDFIVGYQMSSDEVGLALLTHREGGEDGYFMARIAPAFEMDKDRVVPKDICFVMDTSGSMSGKKIEQAREALRFCLDHLNAEDRFNVIPFSTETRPYREALIAATRDNISDAREHAAKLKAIGGTNINDALMTALQSNRDTDAKRPYMIVFLTDGLPTVGETDIDTILANIEKANGGNVRLFVFGVGHDVNTKLLDRLAEDNHGARQYVGEEEDLELKLSGFYTMIAHPVLSSVKVAFGGADVFDVYPKVLPDLFKGTELVLFGRYRNTGYHAITLQGQRVQEEAKFVWEKDFAKRDARHPYLTRLWASRKIGYLLDQMRLHGENTELKDEVVRLAKLHGILTPYTSFLVVEDEQHRALAGRPVDAPAATRVLKRSYSRNEAAQARKRMMSAYGGGSVDASKEVGGMRFEEKAADDLDAEVQTFLEPLATAAPSPNGPGAERDGRSVRFVDGRSVRFVGSRTFYRDGDKWIDSTCKQNQETNKIKLFSDEYFRLIADHQNAGQYFALGNHVVVVIEGKAYETVE
jgi:Ca-activated chloride channel family protein